MKSKITLPLTLGLALLCLTSCERGFLKVVSSSFAKELCSCLFIEEQDPKTCESYASQMIKVDRYQVDQEKKLVIAQAMGMTSSSLYRGNKLGCALP